MVVRIMLMVPLYGVSSLIALFSMEAAFVIDAIRDIYEVMSNHSLHTSYGEYTGPSAPSLSLGLVLAFLNLQN